MERNKLQGGGLPHGSGPRHERALLASILAVLLSSFAPIVRGSESSSHGLQCEASGMCSLGRVRPFTGDILPPPSMRSCLDARSFRKEVILLTETRLNPAYQTFRNLLQMGYEHVVLLSTEERCNRSTAVWPRLACVWSSQTFVSNTKYLLDRVAFMARGARLGFNLLMLDSDVVLFRDVYGHLKAPPLADKTLLAMRDGNGWLNCGVVYVQNARPDGPAVYVLAEVVDRLERWGELPGFFSSRGLPHFCWDQQMYSDTLLSALAGRPVSYGCWMKHEPGSVQMDWHAAHVALFNHSPGGALEGRHYLQRSEAAWPQELLEFAPDYPNKGATDLWWGRLRVPNTKGVWPPELGGPFYPPKRGQSSQQWLEVLQADGPPMWPDPEDPGGAAAAAAVQELFSYLPIYLCETWSQGGAFGYWNSALLPKPGGQPPVVLAHFVHVPGGATNKLTVKMASNNWDWDVAHAAHPSRGVFFASTRQHRVPDVLSYSREVEHREWSSEAELEAAVKALMRLAAEMGRTVAYPAPRCNVSWMGGEKNNKLPLQVQHGFHIPYAPADKGFDDLRCLWGGYLTYGCQAVRWYFSGGLLAPEYDHFLDLLQPAAGAAAVTAASAANLQALGFAPSVVAAAAAGNDTGHFGTSAAAGGGNGGDDIVIVPREVLTPPGPTAAWNVTELAAVLMERYGGPAAGLFRAVNSTSAAAEGAGSSSSSSTVEGDRAGRPRVLVLSEVPVLAEDPLGRQFELFKGQLVSGTDLHIMSCDWIRTGRPYRRSGRRRRRSSAAHRRR